MRLLRFIVCLALCGLCALTAEAQTDASPAKAGGVPVEITADESNFDGTWATASGNVEVRYGSDLLYADRVLYDSGSHTATAEGNVRIYVASRIYRGEHLVYNFDTHAVTSTDFAIATFPVFAKGEKVETPGTDHYRVTNGYVTTSNREHPSYRFKAHTIEVYPNDRVVMKNVVLYVGDVPVFWFPYYAQSVKSQETTFTIRGGDDSRFGGEVFATLNWRVSDDLALSFHEDYRTKRGDGGGVDMAYRPVRNGTGYFSGYYLRDDDHTENPTILPRSPIGTDRYRFTLQQLTPFGDGFEARVNANIWSDPYITEDFFPRKYSDQRMPDNALEVLNRGSDYEVSVSARAQLNRFFDTTERLPELKLETKPTKLIDGSAFEYQSETSVTNFKQEFSNQQYYYPAAPTATGLPKEYSAYRWDTYHQFLFPKQYFGFLTMTPHFGLRGTAWSHDNLDVDTAPEDRSGPTLTRGVLDGGADFSFKISRVWAGAKNESLAIDGLRHVMTPFVNVEAVLPSIDRNDLQGFDDRLPNTWANPIDFPSWNSIDTIDRQFVVRQGIRNEIQTKRDGANWNLVDWSVYTDANLVGTYDEEQVFNHDTYRHVYNEISISPFPWLSFNSRDAIDVSGNSYSMYDNSVSWQPDRSFRLSLGDRLLRDVTMVDYYGLPIPDSNLIYLKMLYRLNEHWQFETSHRFDTDYSSLQEQQYTIYRDLSAWQLGLTYAERHNNGGDNENIFFISLTLKAFPNASLRVTE